MSIVSWNIRGLNRPQKQEDVKVFLHQQNVALIGLLETKVKAEKIDSIGANIFGNWQWLHNCTAQSHGRIWVAWRPSDYSVTPLRQSAQFIHCRILHLPSQKTFLLTFVYGHNHMSLREPLWEALHDIAIHTQEPLICLGDFNAVLSLGDRIGGDEVVESDI